MQLRKVMNTLMRSIRKNNKSIRKPYYDIPTKRADDRW